MSNTQKSDDSQKKPRRARGLHQPVQRWEFSAFMVMKVLSNKVLKPPRYGDEAPKSARPERFGAAGWDRSTSYLDAIQGPGTGFGGNTLQMQNASTGQQSQYSRVEFRPPITPGGQQGYSGTSSTSASGLGAGAGVGVGERQGQVHFGAGGQYGLPAPSQPVQGSSIGANTVEIQSVSSEQQSQYPRPVRFRSPTTPGGQQGDMGYGGTSSTSASGMGAGVGGSTGEGGDLEEAHQNVLEAAKASPDNLRPVGVKKRRPYIKNAN
ncbi:hypothetical protein DFH94DRAFT_847471 [Russula ochroleuca]|uniref:Uncharacterized protein n=1 Tax=Russula ochroleuca TaxID=152965 RepID=A0A9P5JYK0_9AGAM|nr:hypothetical protein DFH94DRAFT_847471 [Russula ochroleuca]